MNVFKLILYMYAIAAAISFFVAFVISGIYSVIKLTERKKVKESAVELVTAQQLKTIQSEAALMENEEEVTAAIAIALHLHSRELHDEETGKLTIVRQGRQYSPWSSKIYGLNTYKR